MTKVISVEHLTKKYDLGVISSGTLARDLERWWARVRKQPDPYTHIGQKDAFASIGESILALDDVSFTVEQGETLGIIGRNGAGKSTLLKILSRVTAPTSGVVKVKGRIGSLLEVGTGFHPELTGRENVYLNGAILGMKKAEVARKFDEIVAFSGVEKFIDTPVKRYSSGMHVRLGFAVAAHLDPEILIVDEVLAVGDAEFQKKCLGKMGDVAGEGRTVLFVSHHMDSIRRICNQVMLLRNGQIEDFGEVSEIISNYFESVTPKTEQTSVTEIDCSNMLHSGSGEARINWARILKASGEPSSVFLLDEEFIVEFGIQNPREINLNYAIELLDMNGYPLFHFESEYEKTNVEKKAITKLNPVIRVKIPPLQLFPDKYYMNLWAGIHHSRVDKVEKCFEFTILKNRTITKDLLTTRGRFYKDSEWLITYN